MPFPQVLAAMSPHRRGSALLDELSPRISPADMGEAMDGLLASTMFAQLDEHNLRRVAARMHRVEYRRGEQLMHQGDPQHNMYIVTRGTVKRVRYEAGRQHSIETLGAAGSRNTIGALHLLYNQPTYATARCTTDVVAYRLDSADLDDLLESSQSLSKQVIYALSLEIKRQSALLRTPLLDQRPLSFAVVPTSIAASIESFYRSALNSWLNYRLTGQPSALFPNMHIQLPARVVYINGFKVVRQLLDGAVEPSDYSYPETVGLVKACVPGLLMTPVSSMLEACNAGHSNPEPLSRRWTRGIGPRGVREVIFGLGINQLSDYCEERVPLADPLQKAFFGSMGAGVVCGYLSHMPHNLSTLKLLQPEKSYAQHAAELVRKSHVRVPSSVPGSMRWAVATVLAFAAPAGLMVRTTQIAGSFCIINGVITGMQSAAERAKS